MATPCDPVSDRADQLGVVFVDQATLPDPLQDKKIFRSCQVHSHSYKKRNSKNRRSCDVRSSQFGLPVITVLPYNHINSNFVDFIHYAFVEVIMTVQRQAQFSLEALRPLLESNGWDVSSNETLEAYLHDATGNYRLVAGKDGRIYLRRTSLAAKPQGKMIQKEGLSYAVQTETILITNITTTLASADEFGKALSEMMSLARVSPED